MEMYATEEQQIEAVKKWFNQYGSLISWILIGMLAISSAIYYWNHHQMVIQDQASDQYIAMIDALNEKDFTTMQNKGQVLIKDYPSSPYATLAALALADEAVEKNDFATAETKLQWAMEKGKQADFQALARVRLMRLLIAEKKLEQALKLYDEKNAGGFLALMSEMKGDILAQMHDEKGAKLAYENAAKAAPEEGMVSPLLKFKMDDLGIKYVISKN